MAKFIIAVNLMTKSSEPVLFKTQVVSIIQTNSI